MREIRGRGWGREGVAASPLASAATSWGGRVALPPSPPACPFSPIHPLLSDVLALNTPALLPASPSNHTLCSLLFHSTPAARGGGLKRSEVWTGRRVSSGMTNAGVQDFIRVLRCCAEVRVLAHIIVLGSWSDKMFCWTPQSCLLSAGRPGRRKAGGSLGADLKTADDRRRRGRRRQGGDSPSARFIMTYYTKKQPFFAGLSLLQ